jgi:hypothetical protein
VLNNINLLTLYDLRDVTLPNPHILAWKVFGSQIICFVFHFHHLLEHLSMNDLPSNFAFHVLQAVHDGVEESRHNRIGGAYSGHLVFFMNSDALVKIKYITNGLEGIMNQGWISSVSSRVFVAHAL